MPPLSDLLTGDLPTIVICGLGLVLAVRLRQRSRIAAILIVIACAVGLLSEVWFLVYGWVNGALSLLEQRGTLGGPAVNAIQTVYLLLGNVIDAVCVGLLLVAVLLGVRGWGSARATRTMPGVRR